MLQSLDLEYQSAAPISRFPCSDFLQSSHLLGADPNFPCKIPKPYHRYKDNSRCEYVVDLSPRTLLFPTSITESKIANE